MPAVRQREEQELAQTESSQGTLPGIQDQGSYSCSFFTVPGWRIDEWTEIYPGIPVQGELDRMAEWLKVNPRRRKKNYLRFINHWLNRSHARALHAQIAALTQLEQRRADAEVGKYRPGMPYYQKGPEWE